MSLTYKHEGGGLQSRFISAFGDPAHAKAIQHVTPSFIDVTLTAAQLDALAATAVELVPAPGAGKVLVLEKVVCFLDYNSAAYAGTSETITIKYENGSGATVATITEAFIESTADAYQVVMPVTAVALANKALVAIASADLTTGNSPMYLRVYYRVLTGDMSSY